MYVQCLAHSMHLISVIIFLEQIVFITKTLTPANFLPSCGLVIFSHTSWSSTPPFFFSCYSNWRTKGIKYLEAALWILLIKVILFFLPFLEAWSQLARLMWRKTCGVSELGTGLHACKVTPPPSLRWRLWVDRWQEAFFLSAVRDIPGKWTAWVFVILQRFIVT